MARKFIDGFESGSLGLWTNVGQYAGLATGIAGMSGAYCLDLATGSAPGSSVQLAVPAASEMYFAFKLRRTSDTFTINILTLLKGAATIGGLKIPATGANSGKLMAYVGTYTNETVAGATTIAKDTTYLIEVRYKVADSGGIIQVKLNGSLEIDYTGDTKPGADTTFDLVSFGFYTSYNAYFYLDDVVIDDANWIGNSQIQGLVASEAGNSTQWTPSAGANFGCVDEVPPSDSDYVSTNTDGHLDLYTFSDLQGAVDAVKSVQVQARMLKEGSPTPQKGQLAVRSGGANYVSGSKVLPIASPRAVCNLWETNPATSAAWTTTGVNGAEFGIKAVLS